ncbi:MAG: transcriptional regulator [Firmicutes bacterium HGW-Firmicutes-15]|nr:MAG: transcriptional regulator [Firmicutes bacterium HGW-Firmicutes-15]
MKIKLAYGEKYLQIDLAECNNARIIQSPKPALSLQGAELITNAMQNPIGTETLREIIEKKSARNAVVVVNDITRPTPYNLILPPLLEEMEMGGIRPEHITLIVATGIHRHHSKVDNQAVFGVDICSKYRIENHNCDDNLLSLGKLSNGMDLIINRTAAEADLLVTTGVVSLHYFAGYSGGRKSILPGIAAREVIEANHKMMNDERAKLGNYEDNPVSDLMIEAARKAKVDFILNVVTQSKKDISFCVAGEVEKAWLEAVKYCEKMNVVQTKEAADIVIASCGGFPKDIDMYQSQKALDAAVLAVKPGGTIILAAECREGLGEKTFQEWIENANCPQDIFDRFHTHFELGGHKAFAICRILEKADILLLSELPDKSVRDMFMTPVQNLIEALEMARLKHGNEASIIIMPEATKIAVKLLD